MNPAADVEAEILRTLLTLFREGDVHELRVPNTNKGTVSGYYTDRERMAKDAAFWSGKAESVYVTLNPCSPDLLARANNRVKVYAKHSTADADIAERRWLLIDFDPKRPAGISATEEQHQAAIDRARVAYKYLRQEMCWEGVLAADSGNGAHLLAPVEMDNDDAAREMLEHCLKALAARFDDEVVEVDQTTFNASRICTLYGTMKCKGDDMPERPHRRARLLLAKQKTRGTEE